MRDLFFVTIALVLTSFQASSAFARATEQDVPSCRSLPPNAVGWWPGEDTRNVLGGGLGTFGGDAHLVPGKWGRTFAFDGINDFVSVPATAGLNLQDFTLEAWIKRGSVTRVSQEAAAVIFSGNAGGYVFGINSEGSLQLGKIGLANIYGRPSVLDDQWHHVAVTKNGVQVRFYVDGAAAGDGILFDQFAESETYGIGGLSRPYDNLTYSFLGLIDDLTLYQRALTPEAVAALAQETSIPRCLDDVALTITGQPQRVPRNEEYSFHAQVLNYGGTVASALRLTNEVIPGTVFVSGTVSQGTVTLAGNAVVVNFGDLAPGAAANLSLRWKTLPDAGGWKTNRMILSPSAADQIELNSESVDVFLVTGECLPTPAGMMAWFRGDDDAMDNVSGISGTATSAVKYVPGVIGSAFSFRENQSYLTFSHRGALRLQDFTVETWIRRQSLSAVSPTGNHSFFLSGPAGSAGFGLLPDGRLYLHNIPQDSVFSSGVIRDLEWHHVAVTQAGTEVRFYIDGEAAGTAGYSVKFNQGDVLWLGGFPGAEASNSYSFQGDIDELAVFSRALSPTEIAGLFEAGGAGRCHQDLAISVVSVPSSVVVDDSFEIGFELRELGTLGAEDVRFLCVLPLGVDFVSAISQQGDCTEAAGVVRCDLGHLPAGAVVKLTLRVRTRLNRDFSFDARILSLTPEVNENNDSVHFRVAAAEFRLSLEPVTLNEGPVGQTNRADFLVRLSVPRSEPVRLAFATSGDTAEAGRDFVPTQGELVIPPGDTVVSIGVPVLGDDFYEKDEAFRLSVTNLSPGPLRSATATATISNDDLPPILKVLPRRWSEGQGASRIENFEATLTGSTELATRFNFTTVELTAREGTDYRRSTGSVEFAPGQPRALIPVEILGDTTWEADETFLLKLSDVSECRVVSEIIRGVIANDDPAWGTPDHFTIEPAAGPYEPGRPFPVVVTAREVDGSPVPDFDGTVGLTARRGSGMPCRVVISEVFAADATQGDFVELVNVSAEVVDLSGWRVLLYGPGAWPEPASTTVIPEGVRLSPGQVLVLEEAFSGESGAVHLPLFQLLIWYGSAGADLFGEPLIGVALQDRGGQAEDVFFAGQAEPEFLVGTTGFSAAVWHGESVPATGPGPHLFQRVGDRNSRGPGDWRTGGQPTPGLLGSDLRALFVDSVPLPLDPAQITGFVAGQWRGDLRFPAPVLSAALHADDGNGHTGRSGFLTTHSDLDQDGLPDEWELAFGLSYSNPGDAAADQDGDGYSAAQEYEAGTNPVDPRSVFRVALRSGRLEWDGHSGRQYELQKRDDLARDEWSVIRVVEAAEEGPVSVEIPPANLNAAHLFRVVVRWR